MKKAEKQKRLKQKSVNIIPQDSGELILTLFSLLGRNTPEN